MLQTIWETYVNIVIVPIVFAAVEHSLATSAGMLAVTIGALGFTAWKGR